MKRPTLRGGLLVLAMAGLVVVALVATGSIASRIEIAAVVTFLLGSATAFGAFDGRARATIGSAPDPQASVRAEHVLASLDGVEHRRVELGTPWPQLSVGPTGVSVIDVCDREGSPVRGASRAAGHRVPRDCTRCPVAVDAGRAAAEALAAVDLDLPVRVIAVTTSAATIDTVGAGRPDHCLVTADRLADALAHGTLLPMPVVDAAFLALSRAGMVVDGR